MVLLVNFKLVLTLSLPYQAIWSDIGLTFLATHFLSYFLLANTICKGSNEPREVILRFLDSEWGKYEELTFGWWNIKWFEFFFFFRSFKWLDSLFYYYFFEIWTTKIHSKFYLLWHFSKHSIHKYSFFGHILH